MEDKSKYTKIYLDEFEQTKPLEKTKLKTYNDYSFQKDKVRRLNVEEIMDDSLDSMHDYMDMINKQVMEQTVKSQLKAAVDTIFLIARGFFENYNDYLQWYKKQEEAARNMALFNDKVTMDDSNNLYFMGKPIIIMLDEDVFDYIRKNYGGVK